MHSPAWIDIHTHVAGFSLRGGVDPVAYGPEQGVAVLTDAGSAPPAELPRLLAEAGPRIVAWANICTEGIAGKDCATHDISGAAADFALREAPGRVVGIKLQASQTRLAERALEALENARAVADRHLVPLLVHVGNAPPSMREVLPLLRSEDIVTHFSHGKPGGALEDGRVHPALVEARARGVLFDIGHGAGSFSFAVMERLMELGFPPDIISTDLHAGSAAKPVGSLADCMSKLLELGMPLADVIAAVTSTPARALQLEVSAEQTGFELRAASWNACDSYGESRVLARRIVPIGLEATP